MDRLTKTAKYPLERFTRCQLCGFESNDICEFKFWQECDENDKPEPHNILITCRKHECFQEIDKHERLYILLPWSRGQPGHLSLLCDDCSYRDGTHCTHPNLKANGGEGLSVAMSGDPVSNAFVCYHDEMGEGLRCSRPAPPFIKCEGLPEDHPRHYKPKEE